MELEGEDDSILQSESIKILSSYKTAPIIEHSVSENKIKILSKSAG